MTQAPLECPRCGVTMPAHRPSDVCRACGHLIRRCAGCGALLPSEPRERCANDACRARLLYLPLAGGQPLRVHHQYAEVTHAGVTYRVEGILRQPNEATTLYRVVAPNERAFRRRHHEPPPRGQALVLKETVLECRGAPVGQAMPPEAFAALMQRLSGLRHPGIARLYGGWQEGARRYVLMERVEGRSVREEFLHAARPGDGVPLATLRQTARVLADAVEYLHRHGIWHRDITPHNVLWRAGQPVLIDFGNAVLAGEGAAGRTPLTHRYAPLEMYDASSLPIDGRADQYLLGTLLFCLAWGVPGDFYLERLGLHALALAPERQRALEEGEGDPQRRVAFYRPDLPAPFAAAIDRLMGIRPADRFADAGEARRALTTRGGGGGRRALSGWPGRMLAVAALAGSLWLGVSLSPGVRAEMHLRRAAGLVAAGEMTQARAQRQEAQLFTARGIPGLWEHRVAAARVAYGTACLDAGWKALGRGQSCAGLRLAKEALLVLGAENSASAQELLRRCRTLCPEGER